MRVLLLELARLEEYDASLADYINSLLEPLPGLIPEPAWGSTAHRMAGVILTDRELEVLKLLAQRLSNKEIANLLNITPSTVRQHTIHIYHK